MYFICKTWPNIAYIVKQLYKHKFDPKVGHIQIAKTLFQ